MLRHKTIKVPLYPCRLVLIDSNDPEAIDKKFNLGFSEGGYEVYGSCVLGSIKRKGQKGKMADLRAVFLVFNTENETDIITPGVIAHECLHFMNCLFNELGANEDKDDEPYNYFLQWAVDECHKFLFPTSP